MPGTEHGAGEEGKPTAEAGEEFHLGDEVAYRDPASPELRFTIGGRVQTDSDFNRQIVSRFGRRDRFRAAWAQPQEEVDQFDGGTLLFRLGFYSMVYKPRPDQLVEEWNAHFGAAPNRSQSQ